MRAWGAEDPDSPARPCRSSWGRVADEGNRPRQRRASLPTEALQPARRVLLAEEMPRRQQRLTVANSRLSSQQHDEGETMPSGQGGVSKMSLRKWITQRATGWYMAPDIQSTKIGQMPAGREVSELPSARPQPGWCAVEPRGFVAFEDLAPARYTQQEEKDAGVHDKFRAQQEIDDLLRAREAVARELAELEEKRDEELQRLQCYHHRRQAMKEKLSRCSDVVARTVDAVDRAHLLADGASIGNSGTAGAAGDAELLRQARVDVVAAGDAVTREMQDMQHGEFEVLLAEDARPVAKRCLRAREVPGDENELPCDGNLWAKSPHSKLNARTPANASRSPLQPLSHNVARPGRIAMHA